MKSKQIPNYRGQVPKHNRKIVEIETQLISLTHIHDRLPSWFGTGTSLTIVVYWHSLLFSINFIHHNMKLILLITRLIYIACSHWNDKTSIAGTVYNSRATPVFSGICVIPFLVFCVVFCRSLFLLFSFSICHCIICP